MPAQGAHEGRPYIGRGDIFMAAKDLQFGSRGERLQFLRFAQDDSCDDFASFCFAWAARSAVNSQDDNERG